MSTPIKSVRQIKKTRKTLLARRLAVALGGSMVMIGGSLGNAYAQQVAFLDSGVDPTRGFNVATGFNYITNSDDTDDVSDREGEGHGTVSARLISEAFSGEIVPFVVTDGSVDGSNENSVRGARDSALSDVLGRDQVRVVGITWGTSGVTGAAAPLLPNLAGQNKVVAIMAGNDFSSQPNTLASSSFNLDGVLIVGATDGDGVLLPESNRAGTTQERYVAAIGLPNATSTEGGTSWATARIAGIAGAVLLQNPDLTAAEVVDVILSSAEDRGDTGTDAVYGRGVILNAQQVLNNVMGPVVIPTDPEVPTVDSGGGGGGGGGAGALLLGGALAGALLLLKKPSTKLEKTLVLDSYGRAFELDLNDHVEINDQALHLNEFFHSLQQKSISDGVFLPGLNTQVAFSVVTNSDPSEDMIKHLASPDDKVFEDERTQFSMALQSKLSSTLQLNAGYRISPRHEFGGVSELQGSGDFGRSSFLSGESFGSVLSGFSSQAETLSLKYQPKSSSRTNYKLGLVSVDDDQRYRQESLSSIFEGSYQFDDNAGLKLQVGQLEERGSLFGSAAGGVFGVDTATTYSLNLTGNIKLNRKFGLVANYGIGRTKVASSEDSLLADFSSLRSDWYSVGAIGNNVFRAKDQVGFAVSQPLKIRAGAVDYSIPVGRFGNGDIRFDTERVNLSDTNATERRFEAYYRTMLNNRLEVGSFFTYRQNPNHVSERGNEAIVMATIRLWH